MKADIGGIETDVKVIVGEDEHRNIVVGIGSEPGHSVSSQDLVRCGDYAAAMVLHMLDAYDVVGKQRDIIIEDIITVFLAELSNPAERNLITKEGHVFAGPVVDVD